LSNIANLLDKYPRLDLLRRWRIYTCT